VQLLGIDDPELAAIVGGHLLEQVESVQAARAGLPDDVVGHLLLAVVVGRDWAHDVARERVALVAKCDLLVGEAEFHGARSPESTDWSINGKADVGVQWKCAR
jgi:hypothetical protein